MTTHIQGTIATIKTVIQTIGPATARQIETHPDVVAACRSSKAKARRLIERLHKQGHIQSTGAQQPHFWVEQDKQDKPIVMETKTMKPKSYYDKHHYQARAINHHALEED